MKYFQAKDDRIVCLLCRHYCTLSEGQIGMCHVEKNTNGQLECLVYNHPSALHIDPIEKKPLYHFLPSSVSFSIGTVGCNLHCPFCQNWQISQQADIDTSVTLTPVECATLASQKGCASISYTYNEPCVWYPYAKDIGLEAKKSGMRNVFVSSGFESDEVCMDASTWIDGANIDLKSFNSDYYKKVPKATLEGVKTTLISMTKQGIWVEVTTLIIPNINDTDDELRSIAAFIADELGPHVPWHISAFHPDYKMQTTQRTPVETIERAYKIGRDAGLYYVYRGNVNVPAQTFCPGCGTLLIERHGFQTIYNHLNSGKCPSCQRIIEGVWK